MANKKELFPQWMYDVLDDMESGRDKTPMLQFAKASEAQRDRLKFYRLLSVLREEGRAIASQVTLSVVSPSGFAPKTALRLTLGVDSAPLRVRVSDEEKWLAYHAEKGLTRSLQGATAETFALWEKEDRAMAEALGIDYDSIGK